MKKHTVITIIAVCLAAVACGYLARVYAAPQDTTQPTAEQATRKDLRKHVSFLVFNTPCQITSYDRNKQKAEQAFHEIMDSLTQLHNTINAYDPKSELSQLNAKASQHPFACSPLLWDMVIQAKQAWEVSDGLFDATVGPLLHLWGFHAKKDQLPSEEDILKAKAKVGFQFVKLDETKHTVRFTRKGMKLDFGGIAKGYALSLASEIAQKHGMQDFFVDLGGNVYCPKSSQAHPKPYRIGIRNPRKKDTIVGFVELSGQCIATSGNYERQRMIQGRKIGHIMDPRTGRPTQVPEGYESVTAITANPTLSDVFSTTVFVGGSACAEKLARRFPSTAFIFIGYDQQGDLEVFTGGPVNFIPLD